MIVIPDVHGRNFWRESISKRENNEEVIFLGDYVDPYPIEGFNEENVITELTDIIELKKSDPLRIHLLIGNHDLAYIYEDSNIRSRYSHTYAPKYKKIFRDNLELFELGFIWKPNNMTYIFSHSGIRNGWKCMFEYMFGDDSKITDVPRIANKLLHEKKLDFFDALECVSYYRGGWSTFGSMVWADIQEFLREEPVSDVFQIVGHTMLKSDDPLILEEHNIACIDCKRGFRINIDNKIPNFEKL